MFAGRAHGLGVVTLLGVEAGAKEELGHAYDPVHGRADLVRHVRQEVALGAARGLRGLASLQHRCLGLFAPGDVANDAGEEDVVCFAPLAEGELERELLPVLAQPGELDRPLPHHARRAFREVAPESGLVEEPEALGHQRAQGPPDDLLSRVAEDALRPGIVRADHPARRHRYDPVGGRVHDGAVAGLALAQGSLRLLALADVADGRDPHLAPPVKRLLAVRLHLEGGAVLALAHGLV